MIFTKGIYNSTPKIRISACTRIARQSPAVARYPLNRGGVVHGIYTTHSFIKCIAVAAYAIIIPNAGMSTSMLVAKMKKAAQADGVEVSIEAKSLADAKKEIQEANIVLLGPQIRYELENVKKLAGSVPVEAIDMRDYGML